MSPSNIKYTLANLLQPVLSGLTIEALVTANTGLKICPLFFSQKHEDISRPDCSASRLSSLPRTESCEIFWKTQGSVQAIYYHSCSKSCWLPDQICEIKYMRGNMSF